MFTVPQAPLTNTSTLPDTVPAELKDGVPAAVWRRIDVDEGSSPVGYPICCPSPQPQEVRSSVDNPDGQTAQAVAPSVELIVPSEQTWQSVKLDEPSKGL